MAKMQKRPATVELVTLSDDCLRRGKKYLLLKEQDNGCSQFDCPMEVSTPGPMVILIRLITLLFQQTTQCLPPPAINHLTIFLPALITQLTNQPQHVTNLSAIFQPTT